MTEQPEVSSPESLLAEAFHKQHNDAAAADPPQEWMPCQHRERGAFPPYIQCEHEAQDILHASPELRRRLSESEGLRALRQQFDEYAHDAGEEWARLAWAIAVRRIDALLSEPASSPEPESGCILGCLGDEHHSHVFAALETTP